MRDAPTVCLPLPSPSPSSGAPCVNEPVPCTDAAAAMKENLLFVSGWRRSSQSPHHAGVDTENLQPDGEEKETDTHKYTFSDTLGHTDTHQYTYTTDTRHTTHHSTHHHHTTHHTQTTNTKFHHHHHHHLPLPPSSFSLPSNNTAENRAPNNRALSHSCGSRPRFFKRYSL